MKEDVEKMINDYTDKALSALEKISLESEKKENLRLLAKQLTQRNK